MRDGRGIKEAGARLGVPIGNYSLNANFLMLSDEAYAREIARVKQHIDMVSDMEISTIRVDSAAFSSPMSENTTEKFREELPLIISTYEQLCDYVKPLGITTPR